MENALEHFYFILKVICLECFKILTIQKVLWETYQIFYAFVWFYTSNVL
jgi:hypothetical protein